MGDDDDIWSNGKTMFERGRFFRQNGNGAAPPSRPVVTYAASGETVRNVDGCPTELMLSFVEEFKIEQRAFYILRSDKFSDIEQLVSFLLGAHYRIHGELQQTVCSTTRTRFYLVTMILKEF